jgi:4-diphosphocytidyl-2-C-methyl-D-erythritol kinase
MLVSVRSFAKINLGLRIGALRPDGFHDLRTVYQTIALHDVIGVELVRGEGIEIRCQDPRVPTDESNTCHRIVERALRALHVARRVIIQIEKRLPVQGGLGGASGNAVATLLALERAAGKTLSGEERMRIAAEVGSDLPLFLVGGTVLGVGHGEEVYPLPELPSVPCVIATPDIGVSTPKAFADWDLMLCGADTPAREGSDDAAAGQPLAEPRSAWPGLRPGPTQARTGEDARRSTTPGRLTSSAPSDRMIEFGRTVSAWLSGFSQRKTKAGRLLSGVPVPGGGGRAETPLLDLVRTGIENDFERVVFPQYPALRDVKRVLEGAGALYASLSGSGSAMYGLFDSRAGAEKAVGRLRKQGIPAQVTSTLTRQQYWGRIFDC